MHFDKAVLALKAETTYGTDATPAGSDAVVAFNVEVTPFQGELVARRPLTPYFRGDEQIPTGTHVAVAFSVELIGAAALGDPVPFAAALKAAGWAETLVDDTSATYALLSGTFGSSTIAYNVDGNLHLVTGWRGSAAFDFNAGQLPMLRFTGLGLYNGPVAAAMMTPTWTGWRRPKPINKANTGPFSLHGTAVPLRQLTFDTGFTVAYRNLIGAERVDIMGRAPTSQVTIEAPALGTKDYFAAAKAETIGAVQLVHDSVATQIVTLNLPTVKLLNPRYTPDQDRTLMLQMDLNVLPTTAGNDEVSLVFT